MLNLLIVAFVVKFLTRQPLFKYYTYKYICIKVSTSYGASIENLICSMMLYFIKTVWGLENFKLPMPT